MPAHLSRFTLLGVLLALVLATGCSDDDRILDPGHPEYVLERLAWDTDGGGDLHFAVEPYFAGFAVAVTCCDFQPVDVVLTLTPADGAAYALTEDIFAGRHDVRADTFEPSGELGTWTRIGLVRPGGGLEVIRDIDPQSEMRRLGEFVRASLP